MWGFPWLGTEQQSWASALGIALIELLPEKGYLCHSPRDSQDSIGSADFV